MTSPPEDITVQCPQCDHIYEDWHRASVNARLDPNMAEDTEYMERCVTSTCPECGYKASHADLERKEVWMARDE